MSPGDRDPNTIRNWPEAGISVTPFEQAVDALASVLLAAAYPSDVVRRERAISTCKHVQLDYLEAMARFMEGTGCSADEARWRMVEYLGSVVGEMRANGAVAREGIGSDGRNLDGLGRPIDNPEED